MKSVIVAVGRWKRGPERALFEHYAARLKPAVTLREVEERKKLPPEELKLKEAELLLGGVPDGARIIVLDGGGKTLSSLALAKQVGAWRDAGIRENAWLIGGADGHGNAALKKADLVLSLGAQTWPHLLVRAMLAEQLFRVQCILSGHPYHRE
ncbi:MAG: 23S rRNA (pseudouridine(1915)-N(3))-methyltransferase RlmH [Rhodospirillaceae bacterium]|nr:23S rRNA (pseudouridine(1915)-N(3))-methyltransferase RlmH [Rhodospirillaceae bacterium]